MLTVIVPTITKMGFLCLCAQPTQNFSAWNWLNGYFNVALARKMERLCGRSSTKSKCLTKKYYINYNNLDITWSKTMLFQLHLNMNRSTDLPTTSKTATRNFFFHLQKKNFIHTYNNIFKIAYKLKRERDKESPQYPPYLDQFSLKPCKTILNT